MRPNELQARFNQRDTERTVEARRLLQGEAQRLSKMEAGDLIDPEIDALDRLIQQAGTTRREFALMFRTHAELDSRRRQVARVDEADLRSQETTLLGLLERQTAMVNGIPDDRANLDNKLAARGELNATAGKLRDVRQKLAGCAELKAKLADLEQSQAAELVGT